MNFGFGHLGHRTKSMTHSASLAILGKSRLLILCSMILALCFMLFSVELASAQRREGGLDEGQAKVIERDEEGKARKLSFFNVINANIHSILQFMSDETNLTIIASDKV